MAVASLLDVLAAGIKDSNGDAVASGTVTFYTPGTLTQAVVYADDEGTVYSQPITLDVNGAATVYTDGIRRMIVNTSAAVQVLDLAQVGGETAAEVKVDSASFTTTDAGAVFDAWAATNNGTDWMMRESSGLQPYAQPNWNKDLVINVKRDGGATGNGSTDDTAAIVVAYNRLVALGGGTLYFPRGTYVLTSYFTISSSVGIRILGDGIASIIKQTGGVTAVIQASDVNDLVFENINLTSNVSTPSSMGGLQLTGCKRVLIHGVTTSSSCDWGVDLDDTTTNAYANVAIVGCDLSGYRSAIRTKGTNNKVNQGPQIFGGVLNADASGGQYVAQFAGGYVYNPAIYGAYISGPVAASGVFWDSFNAGAGLIVSGCFFASAFVKDIYLNTTQLSNALFVQNTYTNSPAVITDGTPDSVYVGANVPLSTDFTGLDIFTGTSGTPNLAMFRSFRYAIPNGSSGTVKDPANFAHLKRRPTEIDFEFIVGASGGTVSWGTTWVDPSVPNTASKTTLVKFRWDDSANKFRPVAMTTTTT